MSSGRPGSQSRHHDKELWSSDRADRGRGKSDASRSRTRDTDRNSDTSPAPRSDFRGGGRGRERDSKSVVDDSKPFRLLRKLAREDDRERKLNILKQFREACLQTDNKKMAQKGMESLLSSLQAVLFERTSKEVKQEATQCMGMLATVMGSDVERYFQWMFGQTNSAPTDDAQILYLQAIIYAMKHEEKKQFQEVMPVVMNNMQTILESANTPDLLTPVMDVIHHIANMYPGVFSSHFTDTVDILVGWHIDSTQKEPLTQYISDALVSFQQFWAHDMTFSLTLLGQFLEDMEAYSEDLSLVLSGQQSSVDEELPTAMECITKISSLLRVFTTVVRSLGGYFLPLEGSTITVDYVIEMIERVVKCVEVARKGIQCPSVLIAANTCLLLLVTRLEREAAGACPALLPCLEGQLEQSKISCYTELSSLLDLVHKVIDQVGTGLPVSFVTCLLGPRSVLLQARFIQQNEILVKLLSIYQGVMGLRNVQLLQEAYRMVVGDLESAYNLMMSKIPCDLRCLEVEDNPFCDIQLSQAEAEAAVTFDILSLAEIGNTKNNLIGMWALTPSLFDLLGKHLKPGCVVLGRHHPAVQYAILQSLYSYCSRHGHFISSSSLTCRPRDSPLLASMSEATNAHFSVILALLVELMSCRDTPYDTLSLALKWTLDIIQGLHSSSRVYETRQFVDVVDALILLGYGDDPDAVDGVCLCLQALFRNSTCLPARISRRVVELCCIKLSDVDATTRESFLLLLKSLPLSITTGDLCYNDMAYQNKVAGRQDGQLRIQQLWLARRLHMAKVPSGTFHSQSFKRVMAFILQHAPPSKLCQKDCLERMYYTCQRLDKEGDKGDSSVTSLSPVINSNEAIQWFWATWEAAHFCVLAKLRTPLGKPQETFTNIEGELKKYAAEVRAMGNEEGRSLVEAAEEGKISSDRLRVMLLLMFLENLEKLLYNAYEGCAVAMVSAPKVARTFFRTNRGTCQEWLTRIRISIIQVALHAGQHAIVVRQAMELLQDMRHNNNTQLPEFEHVLVSLVEALTSLRCPEAIQGVYAWYKDLHGCKLPWVKAAIDQASCRYEKAVIDFQSALKTYMDADDLLKDTRDKENQQLFPSDSPIASPHSVSSQDDQGSDRQAENEADPVLVHYIANQVTDCYMKLDDLDDVVDWQDTLHQYRSMCTSASLQKAFNSTVDVNLIRAMASFESQDFPAVQEDLDLVPGASLKDLGKLPCMGVTWSRKSCISTAQTQLLRGTALCQGGNTKAEIPQVEKCLDSCQNLMQGLIQADSLWWPPVLDKTAVLHMSSAYSLLQQMKGKDLMGWVHLGDRGMEFDPQEHDIHLVVKSLRMLEFQGYLNTMLDSHSDSQGLGVHVFNLRLTGARLARKQQNFHLSERLLVDNIHTFLGVHEEPFPEHSDIVSAVTCLQRSDMEVDQCNVTMLEREAAKLLHDEGEPQLAIEMLATAAARQSAAPSDTVTFNHELNSRSVVTLVKWLQADYKLLTSVASQVVQPACSPEEQGLIQSLQMLVASEARGALEGRGVTVPEDEGRNIGDNPILTTSDAIIGRLLHLSTMLSPDLSKAWFALAGWCYKWGRKAVDNASHGCVDLSAEEKTLILELLPKDISNNEVDIILSILSQIHCGISSEEDISDQDQSLYDDGTETTRKQLLSSCMALQLAPDSCVDGLIDIWKGVVQRVYNYYQLSAKAYLTYLKLNGQAGNKTTNMDGNITSTLRLLRLLVKHAWELRNVLEGGLAHTPTTPWKGIIPQLFSRLNHPEPYVRQSVSDLLCRVAQDAPHLIVYPAVVGCSSKVDIKDTDRDGLLNEYLSQEGEEKLGEDEDKVDDLEDGTADDDQNNTELQNCFAAIVDTLAHHNPQMIAEVQLLVSELRRITLLWDELWLGTLNQQYQDVSRRLNQLENEVKKVMNNSSLSKQEKMAIIREKHKTVLKPTVFTLERLRDITSQNPETPHEEWFHDTYAKTINDALNKLKNPANPSQPHVSWHLFKQFHHSLQQRAQKRTSLVLKMDEISVKVAAFRNTVIAMPGLSSMGQVVTIESIHETVQILPTKTKPKKLIFIGSDGKKYPYLFKGLEDLHLDERIMQFLSIINNMFAKSNRGDRGLYLARHYSVTPLGARSGLIQWVDGATPLFSLYKRWQQREATGQALKAQQGAGQTASNPPAIPRPSEVFYKKLTPALKEKGITNLDNRREWPISVMRRVLESLMADTPRDLLAKELWCSSAGPQEWWEVTQMYARSTAVMSMIGYIIGLGDRHLDNVLVDLATGEVVHIDYNVCFEKGKGLRVPERVPFRMTQNIEAALGVTGIEGTFRVSCEHVIKTMRKGRETLLTLLEAFVYDPLVDWTTGNEGGYTGAFYGGGMVGSGGDTRQSKKDMERDITLSMFSIRVAEMKVDWMKNKEDIFSSLPQLLETMKCHLDTQIELQGVDAEVAGLQDQRQYLQEALVNPSHDLYALQQRYDEYAVVKKSREETVAALQAKLDDCDKWDTAHKRALLAVQGSMLQRMCTDVSQPLSTSIPTFTAVAEFLQGAGQTQLVGQCDQVETELSSLVHQRRVVLRSCLDVLHTYGTITLQFPADQLTQHRTIRWKKWIHTLLQDFSSNRVREVVSQYQTQYGLADNPDSNTIQTVLATETKLQNAIADINLRMVKLYERRAQEDSEINLLNAYVQETSEAVKQFVQDNGIAGSLCVRCALVTALSALSRRYLIMEGAAAAAGDRLMDLTSREGDWFLDELCSMSGNVTQVLSLLSELGAGETSTEVCQQMVHAVQTTHNVYIGLQDLNVNFQTIIQPEVIRSMQTKEASVQRLLDDLDQIIQDSGHAVDALLADLEKQLVNVIMGMEQSNSDHILAVVKQMQTAFEELLQGPQSSKSTDLTPGQMLLMGFNGLFTRLDADFLSMQEAIGQLNTCDTWRKVDIVREARSMQMTAFNQSTVGLLGSMFFLKRLYAMQEFFSACRAVAENSVDTIGYYDDELLARPIKHYIAEYVRKQMIGLPTQTLGYILCLHIQGMGLNVTAEIELKDIGAESKVSVEDLCKKAVDTNLKSARFEHVHLTQASNLIGSHDVAWRKLDLATRLDLNLELLKSSVQRQQVQLTSLQWLHEESLLKAGHSPQQMLPPARPHVMSEIRKSSQALETQEAAVTAIQERHIQLVSSITQRLKWAAGANPSLASVLQQFEDSLAHRNAAIEREGKLAQEVVDLCKTLLHFEALRTRTQEAITADTSFLTLLNRCEESCLLAETCTTTVSCLEEQLMIRRPLQADELVDIEWVQKALDLTNKEISGLTSKQDTITVAAQQCKEAVKSQVANIRGVLATHHKFMSDIRSILKALAKQEDQSSLNLGGSIQAYITTYKQFSENFTGLLKLAQLDVITELLMTEASKMVQLIKEQLPSIYDELVSCAPPLSIGDQSCNSKPSFATALKKSADIPDEKSAVQKMMTKSRVVPNTPPGGSTGGKLGTPVKAKGEKIARDPRTGKALQERNSYAVSVWRRVRMKLDGRDPDINKKSSVTEQVHYVIQEATNMDNLCVLYEGWTPWV